MPDKITVENVIVERPIAVEGKRSMLRVLSEVNFTVPAAGRLAIFGPSGAGKTSLLRLLNRLDDPVDGRVLLDDVDLRQLNPVSLRRRVGMVFQQPFLFDLTVAENLAYPLHLAGETLPEPRAVAMLEEFGLPRSYLERRGPQLSGGEQQRIALARALVLNPEVLLLDEPSSALDEKSAGIMMAALLRRNSERGLTIVMISHSPEIMRRLDGEALLIYEGHVYSYQNIEIALSEAAREQVRIE